MKTITNIYCKINSTMFATFILVLFSIGQASSQSLNQYLHYEGAEMMAFFAHPTNTFLSANYEVNSDYVWMKIYYEDDYFTEIKVRRTGNLFTSILVIEDNDWWDPFDAIEAAKDLVVEFVEENNKEVELTEFEKYIGRQIEVMSGRDLACLGLTIGWLAY